MGFGVENDRYRALECTDRVKSKCVISQVMTKLSLSSSKYFRTFTFLQCFSWMSLGILINILRVSLCYLTIKWNHNKIGVNSFITHFELKIVEYVLLSQRDFKIPSSINNINTQLLVNVVAIICCYLTLVNTQYYWEEIPSIKYCV